LLVGVEWETVPHGGGGSFNLTAARADRVFLALTDAHGQSAGMTLVTCIFHWGKYL
jgi:hypothetical protein